MPLVGPEVTRIWRAGSPGTRRFEDAIRNAISIGGDSDTVAAIAGSIAEGVFGVPDEIVAKARSYLPVEFIEVLDRFAAAKNDPCPARGMPAVAQD